MTDDESNAYGPAVPDDQYQQPITVEAEYTNSESDTSITNQWTFERMPPQRAKEMVVSTHVPPQATLWRIGVWHGHPKDRPDGGHEAGILESETDETAAKKADIDGHTLKIKNWEINYSESNQWEFYHVEKDDHFLYVGAAGKQRDHEWFVIPYIGEMTADHYESEDRRNFHSVADALDWIDSYLRKHPQGHDPNELHYRN